MSTRSTSKPWRASCTAWCDDHADAARELQVLGQEGHAHGRAIVAPCRLRVAFLGPAADVRRARAARARRRRSSRVFVDPRGTRTSLRRRSRRTWSIALAPDARRRTPARATLAVVGPHDPAPEGFDRVLRTPGPAPHGAWRSRPLPVDDRLYARRRARPRRPPRALFVGRSTDAPRVGRSRPPSTPTTSSTTRTGSSATRSPTRWRRPTSASPCTPSPGHGFPSQALLHLAAGQLLLAERLHPAAGSSRASTSSRSTRATASDAADAAAAAPRRLRARARPRAAEGRGAPRVARVAADRRATCCTTCASSARSIPWTRERRACQPSSSAGCRRRSSCRRSACRRSRSARCTRCAARAPTRCTRCATSPSTSQRGEFFGIVGRNGSGKSTLLKCLAGIYAADRGDIYLDGRLSRVHRARRRLQHGPAGARQRDHQRDDARPQPARGAPARRHRRRLRRARPVRRPQAQELLVAACSSGSRSR